VRFGEYAVSTLTRPDILMVGKKRRPFSMKSGVAAS
jgi:hypothetical protein